MLDGEAERAQAVQDGLVEAEDGAEGGVDVQRVEVAVEAVEGGLIDGCSVAEDLVRRPGELLGRVDFYLDEL